MVSIAMMRAIRPFLVAAVLLASPVAAMAQCTGQFGAGTLCGNSLSSLATPKPTANPVISGTLTLNPGVIAGNSLLTVSANTAALQTHLTGTVVQFANANSTDTRIEIDAYGAVARLTGVRADGTAASPTALQSGDEITGINLYGYDGSDFVGPYAGFRCYAAQNWQHSPAHAGTYCDIAVTADNGNTYAESVRFENSGGITVPSTVTGGDEGAGTINAGGLYVNGVATITASSTNTLTNKTLASTTDVFGGVTMTLGSDATGDTYYRNSSGVLTRLAIGTSTYVLTVSGGLPVWASTTTGAFPTGAAGNLQFYATSTTFGGDAKLSYGGAGGELEFQPAANIATPFLITGGSTTGSGTSKLGVDVVGTLNTSGNVIGAAYFANITDTAAGAASTLLDLQVGSTSLFNVQAKNGTVQIGTGSTTQAGFILGYYGSSGYSGMWATGVSPSSSNYFLAVLDDDSAVIFNAVTGGTIYFDIGGAAQISINSGLITLASMSATGTITNAGIGADTGLTDRSVCEASSTGGGGVVGRFYYGTGTVGICLGTSSARYKHDIRPLDAGIDQIMKLSAVSYYLNADHGNPNKELYGFTAEQGITTLPVLAGLDDEGRPNTFDYLGVVPVLVRAVQQQQAEIAQLKERLH